jgi:hypothetical protein
MRISDHDLLQLVLLGCFVLNGLRYWRSICASVGNVSRYSSCPREWHSSRTNHWQHRGGSRTDASDDQSGRVLHNLANSRRTTVSKQFAIRTLVLNHQDITPKRSRHQGFDHFCHMSSDSLFLWEKSRQARVVQSTAPRSSNPLLKSHTRNIHGM